jgi:hypothetical protein
MIYQAVEKTEAEAIEEAEARRSKTRAAVARVTREEAVEALSALSSALYSHLPPAVQRLRSAKLAGMMWAIEELDVAAEMADPAPHPKEG